MRGPDKPCFPKRAAPATATSSRVPGNSLRSPGRTRAAAHKSIRAGCPVRDVMRDPLRISSYGSLMGSREHYAGIVRCASVCCARFARACPPPRCVRRRRRLPGRDRSPNPLRRSKSRLCSMTITEWPASTSRCRLHQPLHVGHVQADGRFFEDEQVALRNAAGSALSIGWVEGSFFGD